MDSESTALPIWLHRSKITRTRIELMTPPWEGSVLTTWPTGEVQCSSPTFIIMLFLEKKVKLLGRKKQKFFQDGEKSDKDLRQ